MKNITITILLILLALLSLFTGFSINNRFSFLYQYPFIDGPEMFYGDILRGTVKWAMLIHWLFLFITNLGIIALPFIYMKRYGKKLVFYIPLLFLICEFFYLAIFIFILVPFVILWLIILVIIKKQLV